MPDQPLITPNEAETVVEKTTNTAEVNGKLVQRIVIGVVVAVALVLLILTCMALFNSSSSLHGLFFSKSATTTLQFQ